MAFRGPVAIGGSWGASPKQRALREFRVARGPDGAVHVVIGVGGSGCFSVSDGGWQSSLDSADITFEIERL